MLSRKSPCHLIRTAMILLALCLIGPQAATAAEVTGLSKGLLVANHKEPHPVTAGAMRGLWLWNTSDVLSGVQHDEFVTTVARLEITDVFVFLTAGDYVKKRAALTAFNAVMHRMGIGVWGLEGWRGYFSDADGPQGLYDSVDALIRFNASVRASQRFKGWQSDMEPQDDQGDFLETFHNGLSGPQLSRNGGGVWRGSQADDREALLNDWLEIHKSIHEKLLKNHLRMAAAMPFWTEDYFGAPVMVTFGGSRMSVGQHMMNYLDDYIVMSYNTDPMNAISRVVAQVKYASTLPVARRPRISAAMETHRGGGVHISYGDTPGKSSEVAVLKDMATITSTLKQYSAFSGVSLHDWAGVRLLTRVASSSDTTAPVILAIATGAITGNSATITWTTNEASTTQVEFGLTMAYGSLTTLDSALMLSHSVALSGLVGSTTYHFRVRSRDDAGNLATSADGTFTTTDGTVLVASTSSGHHCGGGSVFGFLMVTLMLSLRLQRRSSGSRPPPAYAGPHPDWPPAPGRAPAARRSVQGVCSRNGEYRTLRVRRAHGIAHRRIVRLRYTLAHCHETHGSCCSKRAIEGERRGLAGAVAMQDQAIHEACAWCGLESGERFGRVELHCP